MFCFPNRGFRGPGRTFINHADICTWIRGNLACSAGVFFEREICSQSAMLKLPKERRRWGPLPLSFFRPRTYRKGVRKGYYFYSPQTSTVIKSKMAATTILRTRTRFHPPKIRLHCRLEEIWKKQFSRALSHDLYWEAKQVYWLLEQDLAQRRSHGSQVLISWPEVGFVIPGTINFVRKPANFESKFSHVSMLVYVVTFIRSY